MQSSFQPLADQDVQPAEAPQSSRFPWKAILRGTFVLGAVVAVFTGVYYGVASLRPGEPPALPPHPPRPPYDPDAPERPIAGPALTYEDASYVIHEGLGKAIAKDSDTGIKGYIFWAPDLTATACNNNSYLFLPWLLGYNLQEAKAYGVEYLQIFNNTFPQAPIGRGIVNNIDDDDQYIRDDEAYRYPQHHMPREKQSVSPFFIRADIKVLPKKTILEEETPLEKLQQKIRHSGFRFYQPREAQQDVDISDEDMAKSVFGRSYATGKRRG